MRRSTPSSKQALGDMHVRTVAVYDRHAIAWDRHRPRLFFEKPWLDRFASHLPRGGRVLDAGCGCGEPIAGHLISCGFQLTGIDASRNMLALARTRLPQACWLQMDMRELQLEGSFDGIVSWDASFHLTQDEQRRVLLDFSRLLKPAGALLMTIGHQAGEVIGCVEGEQVHHASLDPDEYKETLLACGFADVQTKLKDETCDYHSVLLAVRKT